MRTRSSSIIDLTRGYFAPGIGTQIRMAARYGRNRDLFFESVAGLRAPAVLTTRVSSPVSSMTPEKSRALSSSSTIRLVNRLPSMSATCWNSRGLTFSFRKALRTQASSSSRSASQSRMALSRRHSKTSWKDKKRHIQLITRPWPRAGFLYLANVRFWPKAALHIA